MICKFHKSKLSIFPILFLSLNFCIAQDWADLNRYKKENIVLELQENRIVFMGNSITEMWSIVNPDFFDRNYYVNRGISGQTTPQMLLRFRQDVIELKPKVVIILAGINDIAENTGPSTLEMIESNIVSMTELAKTNKIKVVLCSVLPASEFSWSPKIKPAQKVIALNEKLKTYAKNSDITYVDFFSHMVNELNGLKAELGNDGVHPNLKGYLVMEPILEKGIENALSH